MIWVRLIGGLHDGEVKKVDADQVELSVRQPVARPAMSRKIIGPFGVGDASVSMVVTVYTRRTVRVSKDEIVYFADAKISDLEALQHALGP